MATPYQSPFAIQYQPPNIAGLKNFFNPAPMPPQPVQPSAPLTAIPGQGIQNMGQQGASALKLSNTPALNQKTNPGANIGQNRVSTGTTPMNPAQNQQPSGFGLNLGEIAKQFEQLSPQQRQFFGIGPTPGQQFAFQQSAEAYPRLLELQKQLSQASIPSQAQTGVNQMINELQQNLIGRFGTTQPGTFADIAQRRFLASNPALREGGITQEGLSREVGRQAEPVAAALANLVLSRSVLGEQQSRDVQIAQANLQAQQQQMQAAQALGQLYPTASLGQNVGGKILEQALVPQITTETKEIQTPQGPRQILFQKNIKGQVIGQQDLGPAYVPPNIFNYMNTAGGQALVDALQKGQVAPGQITSRTAPILGAALKANPNMNLIQQQAAANFFEATGTQEKLAWSNSVNTNLDILQKLSDDLPRSDFPILNKAINTGRLEGGSTKAVQFFNAANRTAAELSRVLGDTGGSDFRSKLAQALLDPNYSGAQFRGAVAIEKQMLGSLQQAFKQQGGQSQTNDPLGIR